MHKRFKIFAVAYGVTISIYTAATALTFLLMSPSHVIQEQALTTMYMSPDSVHDLQIQMLYTFIFMPVFAGVLAVIGDWFIDQIAIQDGRKLPDFSIADAKEMADEDHFDHVDKKVSNKFGFRTSSDFDARDDHETPSDEWLAEQASKKQDGNPFNQPRTPEEIIRDKHENDKQEEHMTAMEKKFLAEAKHKPTVFEEGKPYE